MKTKDLKTILKPLIKQCIKEFIYEDGGLKTVVSEVVQGMSEGTKIVNESVQKPVTKKDFNYQPARNVDRISENKKRILDSIGTDAYGGINVFEGTEPLSSAGSVGETSVSGPLSGVDPRNKGIDISSIPGVKKWKILAGSERKG